MAEVGQTITVSVFSSRTPSYREGNIKVRIVETSPCRWEVAESGITKFDRAFNNYMIIYPDFKELMQFIFPRQFPSEPPVSELKPTNKFIGNPTLLELIRSLGNDEMNTNDRHSKLVEIFTNSRFDSQIKDIARLGYATLKASQVVKVEFIEFPGKFAYYVLNGCRIDTPRLLAQDYRNTFSPIITKSGEMNSTLPDMYTLEQITEINYWITHGMLSIYLIRPDIVRSVITNPFVGNEATWRNIAESFNKQYEVLHSIAKPIDKELTVYRGSPHFKPYSVRLHAIFATSKVPEVANRFVSGLNVNTHESNAPNAKEIKLPIGTRVLDLSDINVDEQEVLVFPNTVGSNMVIELVSTKATAGNRNTYHIRNVNEERNRNLPRSRRGRRGGSRRYTRRRR
jgi:hypothetical protein